MIFNEILNFVYIYLFSWFFFLESVYFIFFLKKYGYLMYKLSKIVDLVLVYFRN